MPRAEVFPFAPVDHGRRYAPWIRGLRRRSGVYIIRERDSPRIAYVGESSTDRLYSTLTRHFQQWTNKYDTAGVTYDRRYVEVAVIVVPKTHAYFLQNELICALAPEDNRLGCDQLFDPDDPQSYQPPQGYDYDIDLLVQSVAYQWPAENGDHDQVPF